MMMTMKMKMNKLKKKPVSPEAADSHSIASVCLLWMPVLELVPSPWCGSPVFLRQPTQASRPKSNNNALTLPLRPSASRVSGRNTRHEAGAVAFFLMLVLERVECRFGWFTDHERHESPRLEQARLEEAEQRLVNAPSGQRQRSHAGTKAPA